MRTVKRVLLVAASVIFTFALLFISTQAAWMDEAVEDGDDSTADMRRLTVADVMPAADSANAAGPTHVAATETLINDGSFEDDSAWIEQYTTDCDSWIGDWQLLTDVPAYHGSQYFWAGGGCGPEGQPAMPNSNSAEQRVTVPVTETTLSFWYYADRGNPDDVEPSDYAYVEIDETVVWSLQMTQANDTNGWVNATVDLSRYAGQPILLRFGAYNDPDTPWGNVYFDFVEFEAPSPMIRIISPEQGGVFTYTTPAGFPTSIDVPAGAVSQTVALAFRPRGFLEPPLPPSLQFASHAFDLDAYSHLVYLPAVLNNVGNGLTTLPRAAPNGDTAVTSGAAPAQNGFTFLEPVTITIYYSDEDIAGIDEDSLRLYYWTGDSWADALTTCGSGYDYESDAAANYLRVPVCHLSQFGMAG